MKINYSREFLQTPLQMCLPNIESIHKAKTRISKGARKIGQTALQYASYAAPTAHQAATLAGMGIQTIRMGYNYLTNKNIQKGLCGLILGTAGVVSAAYYIYNEYFSTDSQQMNLIKAQPPLPPGLNHFLSTHKEEIEELYEKKITVGNFTLLGQGASKFTFGHPEIPYVVKVPAQLDSSRYDTSYLMLIHHHQNMQEGHRLASSRGWDHLIIPPTYLVESSKGPYVVEGRLDLSQRIPLSLFHQGPLPREMDAAAKQFIAFVKESRACDIHIGHNAEILKGKDPHHHDIAVYDLDCKYWRPKESKSE